MIRICTMLVLCFLTFKVVNSQSNISYIIPKPNVYKAIPGNFEISDGLAIKISDTDEKLVKMATLFMVEFETFSGIKSFIAGNEYSGKPALFLSINKKSGALGDEGYLLKIANDSIIIEAQAEQGLFYGTRSLLQMVSAEANGSGKIVLDNCQINDYPRYPWRGMHLDVSRHFFDKKFIMKYLDAMALHKLNVFHWHLTDDQGWRVEIKKYPLLTEIGAWREDKEEQEWSYFQYPSNDKTKKLYGGFYTQDDIREIVKYATQLQITIVPEIDVPGHSAAAIYAYPELSCSKKPLVKNPALPFEFSDPLCAGNENTYKFIEDVFSELCELFPGPYFHIGGDECKHTPWETCTDCQRKMKEHNLKDVKELQSYFNQRLEQFLVTKKKRLIGWEEIAEGGMSASSMLMSWKGEEGGIEAARRKMQAVMVPSNYLYFDSYQDNQKTEDLTLNNTNTIDEVYEYNPDPAVLGPADYRSIYGVQAALWTEYVKDGFKAERMTFPRLCALSEVAWTMQKNRNFDDFNLRLNKHYEFLNKANIGYYVAVPTGIKSDIVFVDNTQIELGNKFGNGEIYYTTNGTEPNLQSSIYSEPITINKSTVLKAKVIVSNSTQSNTISSNLVKQSFAKALQINNLSPGLKLGYYEGIISSLKQWNNLSLKREGTCTDFSIPDFARADSFAIEFMGYINIPEDGVYTFSTASDDGTWLFVDDKLLVDNDGCHASSEIEKQIALKKGYHNIKVQYFEALYGNALMVYIAGKNLPKQLIPANMLFKNKSTN